MMTKEELKEYSKIRGLNLGQAEKDYFQTIILFIMYQDYGKELIFKGGTALSKCFGLDRFSEDLDFTISKEIDIKKIEDGLNRFRIEFEKELKSFEKSTRITFRIKGPLYADVRMSLCKLVIDLSSREEILLKPEIKNIGRFLEEVPTFDVIVMQEKEIFAEKIRAILNRDKARDLYDLWFLTKREVNFDILLVNKKLEYYNQKFNLKDFEKKIESVKNIWKTELTPLIKNVPDFLMVKNEILEKIKKMK